MTQSLQLYTKPFEVFNAPEAYRTRQYFRVVHKDTGNWASFGLGLGCFVIHGYLKGQNVGAAISGFISEVKGNPMLETALLGPTPLLAPNWEKLADRVEAYIYSVEPPKKSLFSDVTILIRSWPVVFSFLRTLDGGTDPKELPFKLMNY